MNEQQRFESAATPLSYSRRKFYFRALFTAFFIAVPFLFIYATGYKFEGLTGLVKTGGMYVGAERSGAEIYLNGELVRETGTFRRAFFVQNLEPDTYTIEVKKEGYFPWGKTLPVYPHIVTEARAFNMPQDPKLTVVSEVLVTSKKTGTTATTTIDNPLYLDIESAFASSTVIILDEGSVSEENETGAVATTTKEFQGMKIFERGKDIVAEWTRSGESIPFYFCVPGHVCADDISLNTKGERASYFDFFPGSTDLVLLTLSDGVYVTEIDNRSGQNIQPIFIGKGADFRVVNGGVYIRFKDITYEVDLFEDR